MRRSSVARRLASGPLPLPLPLPLPPSEAEAVGGGSSPSSRSGTASFLSEGRKPRTVTSAVLGAALTACLIHWAWDAPATRLKSTASRRTSASNVL